MAATFAEFIASSKRLVNSLKRAASAARAPLVVVTGNESADLDSIASALSLAYLRQKVAAEAKPRFLPLINIPRADLALRPDAVGAIRRAFGPDAAAATDDLVFASDLDLAAISPPPDVILTDHNALVPSFEALPAPIRVVAIVDHHADQKKYTDTTELRRIEISCGSATSLVAEQWQLAFPKPPAGPSDAPLWTLMLSAILVDTINLDPALGRCFPVDVAAADYLFSLLGVAPADRGKWQKDLFDALQGAKFDVSGMTTRDLLRKDYKTMPAPQGLIGLSTVTWHLDGLFSRGADAVLGAIAEWIAEERLAMEVVMTAYEYSTARGFERELLVVFARDDAGMRHLVERMEANAVIGLEPKEVEGLPASADGDRWTVKAYKMNDTISRKKLMPVMEELAAKEKL
ncbi:hypothetical protein DFJ74DRAFT_754394 [Hyaloraphidium curvatum]|nr:hypothetical protein DFJ74DRAFT_754394 [Hyaloraphidium curvatum]